MPQPDPKRPGVPADPAVTHSIADSAVSTGGEAIAGGDLPLVMSNRYALGGEIARGGMEVYRATDVVLNREVAVKVLQEKFGRESGAARRFADEAQITGRLQHPAIPPVHDLGTLPDGRPFLAMKLIEGQTLDSELRQRAGPTDDRSRFVSVFEQVCQAVAFAHAQGIIHRDLKPANVMVGNFGEVQVMDWGLAKLLTGRREESVGREHPQSAAALPEVDPGEFTDLHVAGQSTDDQTRAGEALGTPAYMPPEQARGETDRVDRRSDVFALGGVLCAILTGKPPFTGASSAEVVGKAATANLRDALARLDACGADAEVIELCKRCLAPEPTDRPADAGEVARRVAEYRAGVEERLRTAERDRAAAATQAVEQRKRRRVWLGSAAALAVAVIAGLAAVLVVQRQAAAELGKKNDELGTKNDDLVEANGKTVAALGLADVREQVAIDAVEGFRKAIEDNPTLRDDPQFADLRATLLAGPTAFCERLRDDLRADPNADARSVARLANVLFQLGSLREVIGRRADALAALTEADDLLTRSVGGADWRQTAGVLLRKGILQDRLADFPGSLATFDRAEGILAARLRDKPDDPAALVLLAKVIFSRAFTLDRTSRRGEVLAVYQAAAGKAAEPALADPENPEAHFISFNTARSLSEELATRQRPEDALRSADDAGAALERYRVKAKGPEAEVMALKCEADLLSARARVYEDLGNTAKHGDARKRVVEVCRDLVARRPSHSIFRTELAGALIDLGRYLSNSDRPVEGLQAAREARQLCEAFYRADTSESSVTLFETLTRSWTLEGVIHYEAGRLVDAILAYREVSRLYEGRTADTASPSSVANYAGNEYNLGILLNDAGRADEAMASYRRSLDLRRKLAQDHPDRPEYRLNVAFTLGNMGKCVTPTDLPAAEGYLRETVAILAELAIKFPKAAVIRDGLPRNRASLAGVLYDQGKLDEAFTLYQENLRANPKHEHSQKQITQIEEARKLLPRLPDILTGAARPATPAEAVEFAGLCTERFQRRYAAAARLFAEAFAADPELAANNPAAAAVAAARAARGDGVDAPADPAARVALRAQALGWLRAELASRRKQAASWSGFERKQAADELGSWLKVSTLSGVRPGLARIGRPAAERAEWDALWADVRATLADARKPAPPLEIAPPPRAK